MSSRAWLPVLGVSAAAVILGACGLFIDPDELVGGNAVVADGGSVVGPNCKPTGPEVCDDGIDNDCNGVADCADPACGEYTCVDAPPGWSPIALADMTRPTCPSHYTSSTDVRVLANLDHNCQCDCGSGCGTLTMATGGTATCTGTTSSFAANTNGACSTATPFDVSSFSRISTTCTPKNVTSKATDTNGRTCAPEKTGGGCAQSQRCVPKSPGFSMCVAKPGNEACPNGFTNARHTGSNITDSRTCGGCACSNSSCSSELEVWAQPQCNNASGAKLTTASHGTCSASVQVNGAKAYKSKTTGFCTVASPSLPQGTLTFQDEQTICCQ